MVVLREKRLSPDGRRTGRGSVKSLAVQLGTSRTPVALRGDGVDGTSVTSLSSAFCAGVCGVEAHSAMMAVAARPQSHDLTMCCIPLVICGGE